MSWDPKLESQAERIATLEAIIGRVREWAEERPAQISDHETETMVRTWRQAKAEVRAIIAEDGHNATS